MQMFLADIGPSGNVGNWIEISQEVQEEGGYLSVKNLEILPTEYTANLDNGANDYNKITIADGVKVRAVRNKGVSFKDDGVPGTLIIESKGTSTVVTGEASTRAYLKLAKGIYFNTTSTESPTKLTLTYPGGTTFEKCSTNYSQVVVYAPEQTTDRNSYETTFDGCDFAAGEVFGVDVNRWDYQNNTEYTFDNYSITINFKNCKIGDAALTASNLTMNPLIGLVFSNYQDKINVFCVIDGTKYKFTWDRKAVSCTLTPVA